MYDDQTMLSIARLLCDSKPYASLDSWIKLALKSQKYSFQEEKSFCAFVQADFFHFLCEHLKIDKELTELFKHREFKQLSSFTKQYLKTELLDITSVNSHVSVVADEHVTYCYAKNTDKLCVSFFSDSGWVEAYLGSIWFTLQIDIGEFINARHGYQLEFLFRDLSKRGVNRVLIPEAFSFFKSYACCSLVDFVEEDTIAGLELLRRVSQNNPPNRWRDKSGNLCKKILVIDQNKAWLSYDTRQIYQLEIQEI